jgi:short-subunit dehydrogenase
MSLSPMYSFGNYGRTASSMALSSPKNKIGSMNRIYSYYSSIGQGDKFLQELFSSNQNKGLSPPPPSSPFVYDLSTIKLVPDVSNSLWQDISNSNIVIIGAGKGLGRRIAEVFIDLNQNNTIIGTSKKPEAYSNIYNGYTFLSSTSIDVRNESSIKNFYEILITPNISGGYGLTHIDYLIYCPGVAGLGNNLLTEACTTREIFDVNFFGAISIYEILSPLLYQSPVSTPKFIVTGSFTSEVAVLSIGAYNLTKYALRGWIDNLYTEFLQNRIANIVSNSNNFPVIQPVMIDPIILPSYDFFYYYPDMVQTTNNGLPSENGVNNSKQVLNALYTVYCQNDDNSYNRLTYTAMDYINVCAINFYGDGSSNYNTLYLDISNSTSNFIPNIDSRYLSYYDPSLNGFETTVLQGITNMYTLQNGKALYNNYFGNMMMSMSMMNIMNP